MARAALNWSLEDAAEAAGVSRRTVLRFERDHRDIKPQLIQAIRNAFENAGVRFIEEAERFGLTVPAKPARP
jgi:transcriptional regulator with XRE-family HTH domain